MNRRLLIAAAVLILVPLLAGCSSSERSRGQVPSVRIAFLQDLTVASHVDLVSPSFLAFDLSLRQRAQDFGVAVEVVQMDTEGDDERALAFAREVANDPSYLLAVIAPFWGEPDEVAATLAGAGVPTLSLSPQSAVPVSTIGSTTGETTTGAWRRLVPDQSLQALRLASLISRAAEPTGEGSQEGGAVCLFAEPTSYSEGLRDAIGAALPPSIPLAEPAPGDLVAAVDAVRNGCGLVVWTGSPEGASALAVSLHDGGLPRARSIDFGADALKTVIPPTSPRGDGVTVGSVTCPCVDVSTSRALKDRRFVNAYQAANGLAPGIYAAEAWDAGEMVAHPLERGIHDRSGMNAAIAGLQTWDGVSGLLRFDFDGELVRPQVGLFVATGTRWLPLGR